MSVIVYTKPRCLQCDATKRTLDKQGIDYRSIDITEDADALGYIKSLGYKQAPVVITDEDAWSGFRPDRIKALTAPTSA
ncbi:glutaredoxin-like protein NrdH [Schaalia cardiffensis]|uniref:glutaredoxin-like protein NrdH n=1 Tax=Schaalia cardiffensis TaxID=181487 RepID=UPI0023F2E671|nr:glutaredoxin-like protein NrdH [Schaalia cardiffensis]